MYVYCEFDLTVYLHHPETPTILLSTAGRFFTAGAAWPMVPFAKIYTPGAMVGNVVVAGENVSP
jgi:hypothetical protein